MSKSFAAKKTNEVVIVENMSASEIASVRFQALDKARLVTAVTKMIEKKSLPTTIFEKIGLTYTTDAGQDKNFTTVVLHLESAGHGMFESEFADHDKPEKDSNIPFTCSASKAEKAYAFLNRLDTVYAEELHPVVEEIYLPFMNYGKQPRVHAKFIENNTFTKPDYTYVNKKTEEVVADPRFSYKVEYMAGKITKKGIIRTLFKEVTVDPETGIRQFAGEYTMAEDRLLTHDRVEDLKTAKNQYAQKFGLIERMFKPHCPGIAKNIEYKKLTEALNAGIEIPDMLEVADLKAIMTRDTSVDIETDLFELVVSASKGICCSVKAKSIFFTRGADAGGDDNNEDAIMRAINAAAGMSSSAPPKPVAEPEEVPADSEDAVEEEDTPIEEVKPKKKRRTGK
jgi:hypothetical protein